MLLEILAIIVLVGLVVFMILSIVGDLKYYAKLLIDVIINGGLLFLIYLVGVYVTTHFNVFY